MSDPPVRELMDHLPSVLAAYGLTADADIRTVSRMNKPVFEITARAAETGARTRLALRVHGRFRPLASIRSELTFLEWAASRVPEGVRLPRPWRTLDGDLLAAVPALSSSNRHGPWWWCDVLTWVDGKRKRFPEGLEPEPAWRLGYALACLHRLADEFEAPPGFEVPAWDVDGLLTERSPHTPGQLADAMSPAHFALFGEIAELTTAAFADLETTDRPRGFIHGDYILGNCHFVASAPESAVGVIDFDDSGWGYFGYDVATMMGNLFDYDNYESLREAFLGGYRDARPLAADVERHLPVLMAARHAACCVWAIALERSGRRGPPAAEHVSLRMDEVRRCLRLA